MIINKIKLNNFRNYENMEIELSSKCNIFYGENAQGKTNLLESVYVASIGKSFRANKEVELIKFDKEYLRLNVNFSNGQRESNEIDYFLDRNSKKQIKDNGFVCTKIGEHFGKLNIVSFFPDDLTIVPGPGSKRRKYIDMMISQISKMYLETLQNYNKYLKIKNTMLKNSQTIDETYLDIIDQSLAKHIEYICKSRKKIISKLEPIIKKIHLEITCNSENLDIEYVTEFENLNTNQIIAKLKAQRSKDIFRKVSTIGIQKDDFEIKINKVAREFFSQGQKRTVVLSLKLAEFELIKTLKSENPIILLDDVFSELDDSRINYLLKYISEYQSIITTNEKSRIKIRDIKYFCINEGKLILEK